MSRKHSSADKHSASIKKTSIEKAGGWKQLSKNVVYDNPWITVSHEEVQRPNGSQGIYGMVHFKHRALGVVALDENNNVIMVKQSRYALDCWTLEIPEGGGLFNEAPLDTAKRELEEETGLCAKQWQPLLTLHTSNSVTDEIAHVYLATQLYKGKQSLDETEDIEVSRMPLSEALDLIDKGKITDAMTIAGLLKVALLLKR